MEFTPHQQRWLWRAGVAVFVLALLILPLSLAVRFTAQSGWWWERGFDLYNAEARTGLPRAELDRGASELRAYFRSDDDFPAITVTNVDGQPESFFSEREILHLRDVKHLFDRTYDAGWASLGFIVVFVGGAIAWRRRGAGRALAAVGVQSGVGVTSVLLVLGVVAISGFDGAFRQFHLVFFKNDFWQLSNRDRLIQMFPQDFFFESTLLIGAAIIGTAVAVGAAGWLALRRNAWLSAALESGEPDAE